MTTQNYKNLEEYPVDSKDTCKECSSHHEISAEEAYKQECDQVFDECWKYTQCTGCPFEYDTNAFCRRYLLYSIPAEQIPSILSKFKEMKS